MQNLNLSTFLFLSFSAVFSWAAGAPSVEELQNRYVEELRPHIKTIQSKVNFYHYANINLNDPRLQSEPGRQEMSLEYIRKFTNYFWLPSVERSQMVAGHGLYIAIDPISTQPFGQTLFVIKAAERALTYLDVKEMISISQELSDAINQKPELRGGWRTLSTETLNDMTGSNLMARQFILGALKKLNVDALTYMYSSKVSNVLCKGRPGYGLALVLIKDPSQYRVHMLNSQFTQISEQEKKVQHDIAVDKAALESSEVYSDETRARLFECDIQP